MSNPTHIEQSEADLVRLAQQGDLPAFEILTDRHAHRVYGVALRILRNVHDAEDVTQQTFLSAIEHLAAFRGRRSGSGAAPLEFPPVGESGAASQDQPDETAPGTTMFGAWLLKIAARAALKVIRKRRTVEMTSLDEALEGGPGEDHLPHPEFIADWRQVPDVLAQRAEVRELLDRALENLDEKHRLIFLLRDVEGLSIRETAEALGLSEGNVKVRLLRARLQLREELTRTLGDPERQLRPHDHSSI